MCYEDSPTHGGKSVKKCFFALLLPLTYLPYFCFKGPMGVKLFNRGSDKHCSVFAASRNDNFRHLSYYSQRSIVAKLSNVRKVGT